LSKCVPAARTAIGLSPIEICRRIPFVVAEILLCLALRTLGALLPLRTFGALLTLRAFRALLTLRTFGTLLTLRTLAPSRAPFIGLCDAYQTRIAAVRGLIVSFQPPVGLYGLRRDRSGERKSEKQCQ
jgi:hypothetical protein